VQGTFDSFLVLVDLPVFQAISPVAPLLTQVAKPAAVRRAQVAKPFAAPGVQALKPPAAPRTERTTPLNPPRAHAPIAATASSPIHALLPSITATVHFVFIRSELTLIPTDGTWSSVEVNESSQDCRYISGLYR